MSDDFLRGWRASSVFEKLAQDHAEWSQSTFGTDAERGPEGSLKHLLEEVKEVQENPRDVMEYADCLLLLLDASRRAGITASELLVHAGNKLEINKARNWNKPVDGEPVQHRE